MFPRFVDSTASASTALSPIQHAKAVTVPTFVVQVHDNILTRPCDVQALYDNIAAKDKMLF